MKSKLNRNAFSARWLLLFIAIFALVSCGEKTKWTGADDAEAKLLEHVGEKKYLHAKNVAFDEHYLGLRQAVAFHFKLGRTDIPKFDSTNRRSFFVFARLLKPDGSPVKRRAEIRVDSSGKKEKMPPLNWSIYHENPYQVKDFIVALPYAEIDLPQGLQKCKVEIYCGIGREPEDLVRNATEKLVFDLSYNQPVVNAYRLTVESYNLDDRLFDPKQCDFHIEPFGSGYPDPFWTLEFGDHTFYRAQSHTNLLKCEAPETTQPFYLTPKDSFCISVYDWDNTSQNDILASKYLTIGDIQRSNEITFRMVNPMKIVARKED